jgi:hypothetical protein
METTDIKGYLGFDLSTKAIDLAVISAEGPYEILMIARCPLHEEPTNVAKTQLAGIAVSQIVETAEQITGASMIGAAIEAPRGYGGPLLPIVGAVTGSLDVPAEWYAPSTWRKILRQYCEANDFIIPEDLRPQSKEGAKWMTSTIMGLQTEFGTERFSGDTWDAIGVALAHRIEIDQAMINGDPITKQASTMVKDIERWLTEQ